MNAERSGYLFSLASKHGINFNSGQDEPFEDSEYYNFQEEYLKWAEQRDRFLSKYLNDTPNLFRVYLPYSHRVFQVASQVLWYLDEIIIWDPIGTILRSPDSDIENKKINLKETLWFLNGFSDAINEGYILLAGRSIISPMAKQIPPVCNRLAEDPEVIECLKNTVRYGYIERPDSEGNPTKIYQMQLDSGFQIGFSLTVGPGKSVTSGPFIAGEMLPPIALEELKRTVDKAQIEQSLNQMVNLFPREIHRTISELEQAQKLGTAVMFDREVDELIINKARMLTDDRNQMATVGLFNMMLPYLRNVPFNHLQELRAAMPNAFLDFRARLYELVSEVITKDTINQAELKIKVEREITSQQRGLEAELKAATRRTRILSLGLPIVTSLGVLVGAYLNVSITVLLGLGISGPIAATKAIAEHLEKTTKLQGHPFYFLWKAQK